MQLIEFIFCLIDNMILYKFALLFLENKDKPYYLFYLIIISILIYIGGIFIPMNIYSTVTNYILVLLFVIFTCKGNVKNKILVGSLYYLLMGIYIISTSFIWQSITGTTVAISNANVQLLSRYMYTFISKALIACVLCFTTSLFRRKMSLNTVEFKTILSVLVTSLCIIFLLAEFIIYKEISIVYIYIISIFALSTVLFSLVVIRKYYQAKIDVVNLNTQNKIMEQHNIQLFQELESDKQIYKIKHDINNLFIVGKELLDEKKYSELNEYFNKIISDRFIEKNVKTIDTTINAIINNKIAINTHLNFATKMEIYDYSFDKIDKAILLGNSLDNAIEASQESKQKIIKIYIKETENILLIHIKNSYNGVIQFKDGKYLSLKRNGLHSGLGINNMRHVVSKYEGKIEINYDEYYFEISIIITK